MDNDKEKKNKYSEVDIIKKRYIPDDIFLFEQKIQEKREHKCRGQQIDNKEWVYGYYEKDEDGRELIKVPHGSCMHAYEVIHETIGEFTGRYDDTKQKNEKLY